MLEKRGLDYVIRAADDRSFTDDGQALFAAMEQPAVQAEFELCLKRHPDRAARTAQMALRFGTVTLRRPKRAEAEVDAPSLTVSVVDVREMDAPEGETAVPWHSGALAVVDGAARDDGGGSAPNHHLVQLSVAD